MAEGSGRGSRRDYARFAANSKGSLCELETLLEAASMLHLATIDDETRNLCDRVSMMLTKLRQSLLQTASR